MGGKNNISFMLAINSFASWDDVHAVCARKKKHKEKT